jgi:NADPH:quinone reductase
MMRAAVYSVPGPARDVLTVVDVAIPDVEPGEVLIRVKASGINPSDYKRRRNQAPIRSPMVPHSDGAGIIEKVGEGVSKEWLGRAVWVWNAVNRYGYAQPAPRELGTAAEFVVLPLEFVAPLPDGTSFEVGACLGVPAFTAYAAVHAGEAPADRCILIQGGAGAVGELAVQLARWAGATVIATVSGAEKAERAIAAGAHHVVNYREQDVVEAVRKIAPEGFDKIIEVDFAANIKVDAQLIRPYGSIVSYSSTSNAAPQIPYYDLQFKGISIHLIQVFTMPPALRLAAIDALTAALEKNTLRPTIAKAFPLEDIAAAHEYAESGPNGNVVLSGSDGGFL